MSRQPLTPILGAALVVLAACGGGERAIKARDDPQFARTIADTAAQAAVARPGAAVCREMRVGIAERDWIGGTVVAVEGTMVDVRVDNAGRFLNTLNGVELKRGVVARDDAAAWIPCLGDAPKSR